MIRPLLVSLPWQIGTVGKDEIVIELTGIAAGKDARGLTVARRNLTCRYSEMLRLIMLSPTMTGTVR